jgi:hypothetical protein
MAHFVTGWGLSGTFPEDGMLLGAATLGVASGLQSGALVTVLCDSSDKDCPSDSGRKLKR